MTNLSKEESNQSPQTQETAVPRDRVTVVDRTQWLLYGFLVLLLAAVLVLIALLVPTLKLGEKQSEVPNETIAPVATAQAPDETIAPIEIAQMDETPPAQSNAFNQQQDGFPAENLDDSLSPATPAKSQPATNQVAQRPTTSATTQPTRQIQSKPVVTVPQRTTTASKSNNNGSSTTSTRSNSTAYVPKRQNVEPAALAQTSNAKPNTVNEPPTKPPFANQNTVSKNTATTKTPSSSNAKNSTVKSEDLDGSYEDFIKASETPILVAPEESNKAAKPSNSSASVNELEDLANIPNLQIVEEFE